MSEISKIQWCDMNLRDKKGGDPSEWPADLRVQEWPQIEQKLTEGTK